MTAKLAEVFFVDMGYNVMYYAIPLWIVLFAVTVNKTIIYGITYFYIFVYPLLIWERFKIFF